MATIAYMRNRSIGDSFIGVVDETIDPSASSTVRTYASVSTSEPQMVKDGSTFISWNTERDGSGTSYQGGETVSGTVHLYAIWTAVNKPYIANGDQLLGIADAIRSKTGGSEGLSFPDGFVNSVGGIVTLAQGTADATATASDIRYMKSAYVNGQKVNGLGIMYDEIKKTRVTETVSTTVQSPVTINAGQTVTLSEVGTYTFTGGMLRKSSNNEPFYSEGSKTTSPSYDHTLFTLTPIVTWTSNTTANVSWRVRNKSSSKQTFAKNPITISLEVSCDYPI